MPAISAIIIIATASGVIVRHTQSQILPVAEPAAWMKPNLEPQCSRKRFGTIFAMKRVLRPVQYYNLPLRNQPPEITRLVARPLVRRDELAVVSR